MAIWPRKYTVLLALFALCLAFDAWVYGSLRANRKSARHWRRRRERATPVLLVLTVAAWALRSRQTHLMGRTGR